VDLAFACRHGKSARAGVSSRMREDVCPKVGIIGRPLQHLSSPGDFFCPMSGVCKYTAKKDGARMLLENSAAPLASHDAKLWR
jgi:hypothetical protein